MILEAPIEIARNKRKLSYLLGGGIVVLLFGLFIVLDPGPFKPAHLPTSFIIVAIGVIIMVIAGIYCYIMAVRIASVFPGMIVSEKDIYDHTGSPGDGLIKWEDITEVRESDILGRKHLTIVVKNPQAYIDRQKNPVKRKWLARANISYGSPIQIKASDLDFDFESLKALLTAGLERHRNKAKGY